MSNTITSFDAIPETPAKQARQSRRPGSGRTSNRYDAAQTTDGNRKHWANADYLSARAANSPLVRARLRARSRYEIENNGYASGLVLGRTEAAIGTGPRLQLDLPEEYADQDFQRKVATGNELQTAADLARAVECKWCEWAKAVGLTDKAELAAEAEDGDGETFIVFITNPKLPANGPQLDLRLYEADQVTTPTLYIQTATQTDGIVFDEAGNPIEYHFLKQHPGDTFFMGTFLEFDRVPAHRVVHLFRKRRAGQLRGIPILTPGLPLYAILRRYTLASLLTAEAQARINAVITQDNVLPGCETDDEDADDGAGEQIHFAGTQMLTLSAGQKAQALETSSPAPAYREFKSEILTEAGRATGAPRNISIGSSADYNYSSGRLDLLPDQRGHRIRRGRYEREFLDRVYQAWLYEALLIPGYLPAGLPPVEQWKHKWHWDGFESIDPLKDANAVMVKKESGLTTDADELAKEGKDWREHYQQLAREKAMRKQLDIEPAPIAKVPTKKASNAPVQDQLDQEEAANV